MSTIHKTYLAIAGVILLVGLAITSTYLVMSARQREAVATTQAQALDAKIKDAQERITKRDQDTETQRQELQDQLAKVKTTAQAAPQIQTAAHLLVLPRVVSLEPGAPIGQEDLLIPGEDVIPLNASLQQGAEREKELEACQADKKDLGTQLNAAQQKAKDWRVAAKGGNKLQRVWSASKKLAYGAAIGAVAVLVAQHH